MALQATYTVRLDGPDSTKLESIAAKMKKKPTTLARELLVLQVQRMPIPTVADARQMTIDDLTAKPKRARRVSKKASRRLARLRRDARRRAKK